LPQPEKSRGAKDVRDLIRGQAAQLRRTTARHRAGERAAQNRPAKRLEFGPWGDELRAEHDLRHTAKGSRRGKKRLAALAFPHDMKDGFIVGGIDMMTMGMPMDGTQVDLDVAKRGVGVGFSLFAESHDGVREIGPAAVIPKSGLDDFHCAPVVRLQERLIKLLEPKRLDFEFSWSLRRFFAQRTGRQVRRANGRIFHSRNLIPRRLKP